MSGKVLLLYPSYDGPPLGPPLSLLSLASPLLEAGFHVRIVDGAINAIEETLEREIHDSLCIGISFLTGPMIRGAVRLTRLARRLRPEVPIIFGGWHSSLLPDQTLRSGLPDFVVRGQGEKTLLEIAQLVRDGKSPTAVAGTSIIARDQAIHHPDRAVENINNLPTPAF